MSRGKQQIKKLNNSRRKIANHNLSHGPGADNLEETKIEFSYHDNKYGDMTFSLERILDKTKIRLTFRQTLRRDKTQPQKLLEGLLTLAERKELLQAINQVDQDINERLIGGGRELILILQIAAWP